MSAPTELGGSDTGTSQDARYPSPGGAGRGLTHWVKRLALWACPILCLALATAVLVLLGLSWLSAVAIVAGTSCLAIIVWGAREILRARTSGPGAARHTPSQRQERSKAPGSKRRVS